MPWRHAAASKLRRDISEEEEQSYSED